MSTDWTVLVGRLADELVAKGKLTTSRWQAAFRATPRHVFVPEYFVQDDAGSWRRVVVVDATLVGVYRNVGLFTDVDADGRGVSSSSEPGLMTRMLELLDVRDGHRVLEIGTGTGYNTALLCAGLGDRQVSSIDVDYTDAARRRLASLGYRPTLRAGDGVDGIRDRAPFDRIVATVAVPYVPGAWLDQLADDGAILVDVKLNPVAGNLVLLRKRGDIAEGRFDAGQAWFMEMRHPGRPSVRPEASVAGVPVRDTTTLPAVAWKQPVPWFLACLAIGQPVDIGYRLDDDRRLVAARVTASDGSWAEVDTVGAATRAVAQAGPIRLWDAVELAFQTWADNGNPTWNRLGLTVGADGQRVWLDSPDGLTLGHLRAMP